MTQEEIIQGNKLIDSFMGYIIYEGEEYSIEKDRNTHESCGNVRSNTIIKFYHYKWGEFFNNKVSKCFKFKKYKGFEIDCFFDISDLKYHTSWDWLMPVVKKFDYLAENKFIDFNSDFSFWCEEIDDTVTRTYEIEPVFKIMIKAITWYNTQNTTP